MAEQQKPRREYARIYRSVLATLLLLAVTPLVALGWFAINRIDTLHAEKISSGLEALTLSKVRAIDTFFTERIAQVRNLAQTHSLGELSDAARLSAIFSVMQSNGRSFVDLGVIGLDGRHVSYVGPYDLKDADYHEASWFNETLHRGMYVSNCFLGKRKVPHFIIAVLRHDAGKSYIVRATVDMAQVNELMQRSYSGSRADAFLMTADGILQTDSLYYGKSLAMTSLSGKDMHSDHVVLRELDPRGELPSGASLPLDVQHADEILGAFARLKTMPWILVVADDVQEALVPLRNLKLLILCFVLAGTVLVAAGAFASTRRLVSSIAEKDREQANIDARLLQSSKMAALGKMASGVAHEVNNPLMLIQENCGWITDLMDDEDRGKMKNYDEILASCEKINANVQRARGITQRMLGFGRRMNPGRAEVMLGVVADHVVELLDNEAKGHRVEIVKNYGPDVPVVLSDPAQLEQVVLNIVDNAIDAIGKDGRITITTAGTSGGGAQIAIADNGPGLDPETKARIFDPFFTTKAVGEGTGLGLAISYSILQKLGGTIDCQSKVGVGTTFTISLPPEPPQALREQDEDEGGTPGL